jgi:hypothetical protein
MNPLNEIFYANANVQFNNFRVNQIRKGFKEYGKAYNPLEFTPDEQMEHFMSELPDILHYGYGMYVTMKNQQEVIERQQERLDDLEAQLKTAMEELDYWETRYAER